MSILTADRGVNCYSPPEEHFVIFFQKTSLKAFDMPGTSF